MAEIERFKRIKKPRRRLQQDGIDRLSALPDNILVDILSLVPLKSATSTSVLSTRWRYLWTQIINIDLDYCNLRIRSDSDNFTIIIDRVLSQLKSPKINRFCLHLPYGWRETEEHWSSWILDICGRKTAEIEVRGTCGYMVGASPLPFCILQCQSLVVLQLVGDIFIRVPDDGLVVTLPNLKKIDSTSNYALDSKWLGKLFKSCPLLEDLTLTGAFTEEEHYSMNLSAPHLKKLNVHLWREARCKFTIDAPELREMKIDVRDLLFVCFINNSSTLVNADICLTSETVSGNAYASSQTLPLTRVMASSVRSLHLNSTILKIFINVDYCFDNLTHLRINLDRRTGCWNDVLHILRCSSSLEILYVSSWNADDTPWSALDHKSSCFPSQLKRIELKGIRGNDADFEMIKYILNNANVLEVLDVGVYTKTSRRDLKLWQELKFCETIFALKKSCLGCEINVSGELLKSSGKGFNDRLLDCQIRCQFS